MSKRLQVVLRDAEYAEYQRVAKRKGITLAEWVRQVLRLSSREEPRGDVDRKVAAVREGVRHEYPSGDIEQMLAEIESGYLRDDDA